MHGFTDWSARRPVIFLSYSRSDGRRRFTLGHEIGHIVTGTHLDPFRDPDAVLMDAVARKTEIVSDVIAAELLLPKVYLHVFAARCRNLDDMRFVAREMRVSPSMLVTRLMTLNFPKVLIRMRRTSSGQWIPISRAGTKQAWKSDLDLEPASQADLDRLGKGTVELEVAIRRRSGITTHFGEAWRCGASEVLLYLNADSNPAEPFQLRLAFSDDIAASDIRPD